MQSTVIDSRISHAFPPSSAGDLRVSMYFMVLFFQLILYPPLSQQRFLKKHEKPADSAYVKESQQRAEDPVSLRILIRDGRGEAAGFVYTCTCLL